MNIAGPQTPNGQLGACGLIGSKASRLLVVPTGRRRSVPQAEALRCNFSGYEIQGSKFQVPDLKFQIPDSRFRILAAGRRWDIIGGDDGKKCYNGWVKSGD